MHTKTTFIAGLGYTRNGEPIDPARVDSMAIPAIRALLSQHYGGFTEQATIGGWFDGSTVITEPGRQWVTLHNSDRETLPDMERKGRTIARQIASILDQASVVMQVEELRFDFVSQTEEVENV